MKFLKLLFIPLIAAGCSSVILQPSDFSWPVEDVIKVDGKGIITTERYTFSVNVKPLFQEEFADSNLALGKEVRIIRDKVGYYYITASNFKNVYLLMPVEGGMKLEETIKISETQGLSSPVFNQKTPNIELLDGSNKYLLNCKGIVR
jgi:hypothetical protein